jgi:hypothetical protein
MTPDKHLAERFKAMARDLFAKADDFEELLSNRDVAARSMCCDPVAT